MAGQFLKIQRSTLKRMMRICICGGAVILILPVLVILCLKWVKPPVTSYMLQKSDAIATIEFSWLDYEDISPYLILAAIASEDVHFPRHRGFDFRQIKRAFIANRETGTKMGASTISQQVAKNLFLWPAKNCVRKGLEAYLTLLLELFWSKKHILEVYLNIVETGPNRFGVEDAARHYFHKSARMLNAQESASLIAILPNPSEYAEALPSPVEERTQQVLARMARFERTKYLRDF